MHIMIIKMILISDGSSILNAKSTNNLILSEGPDLQMTGLALKNTTVGIY